MRSLGGVECWPDGHGEGRLVKVGAVTLADGATGVMDPTFLVARQPLQSHRFGQNRPSGRRTHTATTVIGGS